MKKLLVAISCLIPISGFAEGNMTNKIHTGLGVSLPTKSNTLNFSENPVGIAYQNGLRFGIHYGKDSGTSDTTQTGISFGYGGGSWGLSLDQTNVENTTDNTYTRVGAAALIESISTGFGVASSSDNNDSSDVGEFTTLGVIINPTGIHRFGIVINNVQADNNDSTQLGYSYVGSEFAFTVDREDKDTSATQNRTTTVLGLTYFANEFQLNISYAGINDDDNTNDDNNLQVGIGLGNDWIDFAAYSNHIRYGDLAVTLNLYF